MGAAASRGWPPAARGAGRGPRATAAPGRFVLRPGLGEDGVDRRGAPRPAAVLRRASLARPRPAPWPVASARRSRPPPRAPARRAGGVCRGRSNRRGRRAEKRRQARPWVWGTVAAAASPGRGSRGRGCGPRRRRSGFDVGAGAPAQTGAASARPAPRPAPRPARRGRRVRGLASFIATLCHEGIPFVVVVRCAASGVVGQAPPWSLPWRRAARRTPVAAGGMTS